MPVRKLNWWTSVFIFGQIWNKRNGLECAKGLERVEGSISAVTPSSWSGLQGRTFPHLIYSWAAFSWTAVSSQGCQHSVHWLRDRTRVRKQLQLNEDGCSRSTVYLHVGSLWVATGSGWLGTSTTYETTTLRLTYNAAVNAFIKAARLKSADWKDNTCLSFSGASR